jgi:DNA-binding FadR family transcriptional regulator
VHAVAAAPQRCTGGHDHAKHGDRSAPSGRADATRSARVARSKSDNTGESDERRKAAPNPRVHGAIAKDLGVSIVSGRLKVGELLQTELEAAEQLKVSRSAYREAIRILAAKGLVDSRPKTGTRVTPRNTWNLLDPQVLAWFFESDPSEDFLRGLFELRMIIEPAAAGFAAERRDAVQLERMRNALVRMQAHTVATEDGRQADREFHDTVLEATRNDALIALTSSIGAAVRWTTIFKQRKRDLPRDPMPEHWHVFDAIAAQRVDEARDAMAKLVAQALEDTRSSI